ncbi:hypothetical protein PGT21_023850 [Puccinia graminis f. sp. tritici]|uniref:No apical meristem-associated C-terminal domain-containing protein n=1 Tax=Puccinia graminis f. sp. tritici TaxID=56615 RepID=A0A5B0P8N2_PUCGR|nr:hypothetical protein PGT21_023850 [Puccinia graminis f. sp. tritici]
MEATHKESVKRSAEAKRSNDIQAELVAGEQKKIDVNLMFQNPANCPDDISHQSSHAPTDRSHSLGLANRTNAMSPYDRQEDEDIPNDKSMIRRM